MKVENLTKHICDICGKIEYLDKGKKSPLCAVYLPMKIYDETGRQRGISAKGIDICPECLRTLENDLSQHYVMSFVSFVGVEIKRHPTERAGE